MKVTFIDCKCHPGAFTERKTGMNFPPNIYVKIEREGSGEEYYIVETHKEALANVGDKIRVGVYRRVKTITLTTKVEEK